jgi:TonB family protein
MMRFVFMLMGLAATAEGPSHGTTTEPRPEVAAVPAYIQPDGTFTDSAARIYRWLRAGVEFPGTHTHRNGEAEYAGCGKAAGTQQYGGERIRISNARPRCASRFYGGYEAQRWTSGGLQQADGGSLYPAAWFPACSGATTSSSGAASAAAHHPLVIVSAGLGRGFPDSSDYYPAASLRLGETGVITIRACVGKDGFLTISPRVQKSSGSPYLDAAALKLASDGTGHYRPATVNGRPVEAWLVFTVTFVIDHGPNVNRLQR